MVYFRKAIDINSPNQAHYIFKSGCVNLKLERYKDSLEDFKRAKKARPENSNVYYFLGRDNC